MSDQDKPTAGEWTEGKVFAYFESEDFAGLAQAINAALAADKPKAGKRFVMNGHIIFDIQANAFIGAGDACYLLNESNAALAAEREKVKQLLGSKHCPAPENELGDSSGDVSGWDLIPVVKSNGELWLGLATIRLRNRPIATLNEQEAKGLLAAISAELAAERERLENDEVHRQQAVQEIYADKLADLEAQLAAEREAATELCKQVEDYHRLVSFFRNEGYSEFGFRGDEAGWTPAQSAIEALKQLSAEREKFEAACEGRDQFKAQLSDADKQLAAERKAGGELIKMHTEAVIKCNEARKQLAAELAKIGGKLTWTYQIDSGYWRIYERGVEIGTVLSELNASSIVAAHNGALASERERTRNIISERNELAVAVQEWKDASNEHAAMRVKFREQLDAEREKVQTLVDALKEFENEYPHVTRLLETVR